MNQTQSYQILMMRGKAHADKLVPTKKKIVVKELICQPTNNSGYFIELWSATYW